MQRNHWSFCFNWFFFSASQKNQLYSVTSRSLTLVMLKKNKMPLYPVSILHKSTAGRYRPVRVADRPITARCRFLKNDNWVTSNFQPIKLLDRSCWYKFILNSKQCRSRSVGFFRSQLIWICTVCKSKVYPGSAGLELNYYVYFYISLLYYECILSFCFTLVIWTYMRNFNKIRRYTTLWYDIEIFMLYLLYYYYVYNCIIVRRRVNMSF